MATVLVTGANRGIGLESRQLKAQGDQVVAVCRQATPELEALGVRIEDGIELTEESPSLTSWLVWTALRGCDSQCRRAPVHGAGGSRSEGIGAV